MARRKKKRFDASGPARYRYMPGGGGSAHPKPEPKPAPSRQSGGTSGDLTVKDHVTRTPVIVTPSSVSAGPSRKESSVASVREPAKAAARAEVKQRQVVEKFVAKAYKKPKENKEAPSLGRVLDVGRRSEEAKKQVAAERDRLLNHPAVQEANTEGKVVSPKGLQKIKRREDQAGALSLPGARQTTKKYGRRDPFAVKPLSFKNAQADLRQRKKLESALELLKPESKGTRAPKVATLTERKAGSHGGESVDPIALAVERDVIQPAADAGVLKGKTFGQKAYQRIAEYAPLAISFAPEVMAGAKALGLAARGAEVSGEKVAAGALSRILKPVATDTPAAKAAVTASRREALASLKVPQTLGQKAGTLARRVGERQTQKALAREVTGTATRKEIARASGLPLLGMKLGTPTGSALLEGTARAFSSPHNAKETTLTTARAIPAAVTAPAALLYGAGQIPFEGTGPLAETAKMQYEGLRQLGSNLLSGDPKKVQKAVEKEGALTLLTPLPALSRLKAYKAARGDLREAAAGIRRTTGKGRQAPKGVEQSVFGFTDRKAARSRVAKTHTRTTNPYEISKARHKKAILHGTVKRPALEKVPAEWGDTISTLLEAGIRDPEGVRLMRERGPKTEPNATGKVNLDRALKIAEDNEHMFDSVPFQRALRAAEKASRSNPAALAGMGEVARYRTQGRIFGITPPDQAVPFAARKLTKAKTRAEAWRQVGKLRQGRKKDQARKLEEALDPFTRPDQKTASGKRKFWDDKLEAEFIGKVKTEQDKSPLVEPAWTHHATFQSTKAGMEPGMLPGKAGGKAYVNRGRLAESDLVDRSLQAFIRGTVEMPRARQAGIDFAQEFVRQEKHPFTLGGKKQEIVPDSETWARITSAKTKENPDGGQFDPETYARFPIREWKTVAEDPFTTQGDLAALVSEAEAGRIASHEPSIIVPREAVREFKAIVNPEHGPVAQKLNTLSRTSSRLILGTNPSWVLAQTIAEGIPLALAKPSLLNPAKSGKLLKELERFRKENPEKAAVIEGAAGASPEITAGSLRSPLDLEKQHSFNPQPAMFASAAKELTRSKWGRAMRSTAKLEPLGLFDIKRQNAYRSVLLAAEADKRFRAWTGGVQGMFRTSARLSERFKGKTRQELYEWLSTTKQGKKELQKLADYVDDVQGNWTAFSRYEKAFAPFVIFYPFLRYSLRWTLHTFPKTHPLTATLAYTLGQVNSNELEKVLGAKPSSPLGYTWPVVADAQGKKSVLPGGSRVAPGLGTPQQAVLGGNASQLAGALNPILGAGLTAIGGPGPFGDKPTNPAGWAALDQLLALPAPLRLADIKSEKVASMLGIVNPQAESVIAKAFKKLDPNKKLRQGLLPSAKQSGKEARMTNELSRALDAASANSKSKREEVAGDDSLTVQERQKRIKSMERKGDKAKAIIDRILKDLELDKENKAAYERYKAALYGGDDETSIYDAPKKDEGTIYDQAASGTTSIYGDENNPALKYKPPGAPGIDLPNVRGALGAIGGTFGALVGGEAAQAQTLPKALERKVVGKPSVEELIRSGQEGTLKIKGGKISTPAVRKATKDLRRAEARVGPVKIEGIENPDQREFAEWLSHYAHLPPKLAGEWTKQEGGGWGSDGVSGGEAGEQNWLGVGYPGERTPMSESRYFNGVTPKQAAKNTALWMEGKIGHEYNYGAAPSIQGIPRLAKGGASEAEIKAYIEGPSAWGTGSISQTGITVNRNQPRQAKAALRTAKRNARKLGINPTPFNGDVERGEGKTVTVRADAKGMVNWAKSAVGVDEGSAKQLRWAGKTGLGSSEPWCANFVSVGLMRRGITDLPSNPNYVPTYESEWGKYAVKGGLAKAKPGDLLTFGSHIGVYVGNGEMVSGNSSDAVSRTPAGSPTMVLRPPYRGGKIQIHESTILPGATQAAAFAGPTTAPSVPGLSPVALATTQKTKPPAQKALTKTQKLEQVEQITEGRFPGSGALRGSVGPSAADLAAIGASLSRERQRLGVG